jgi:RNA polymerase sigma-70 factor (ECF subfamily)
MMTTTVSPTNEAPIDLRQERGGTDAFEAMVRQYGGRMLAVARRLVRNEEDAREVVQDAFLNAFRALGDYRAEAQLSSWLHRIVVNTALMRLRSASRKPEGFLADLLPGFDETGRHGDPVAPMPMAADEAIERAEIRGKVRAAVARLPEAYRAVIVLRDFEECSTAETATALGISENAAKIRLHRARQALATLLTRPA